MQGQVTRRYPRIKPPDELLIAWQTVDRKSVSRAETIALGGLFVRTPQPLPKSSVLQLLFDWRSGEARARGIVRHVEPRRGMGIEIISMDPNDRLKLAGLVRRAQLAA